MAESASNDDQPHALTGHLNQLRQAQALELAREGVPPTIIQRQLGHTNLGTTSIYLQGIDPEEIIATVRARRGADDVGQRRAAALTDRTVSGSAPPLPLRPDGSRRVGKDF